MMSGAHRNSLFLYVRALGFPPPLHHNRRHIPSTDLFCFFPVILDWEKNCGFRILMRRKNVNVLCIKNGRREAKQTAAPA